MDYSKINWLFDSKLAGLKDETAFDKTRMTSLLYIIQDLLYNTFHLL